MKKILLSICCLAFAINTFGQTTLPGDFSRRLGQLVNNPHLADSVFAGIDSTKVDGIFDSLTVIKDYLFILRQDYSLYDKKKKKYYGFNNEEQFGTTYSLGIKCNGYNIYMDEAIHPWVYDSKYDSFKSNKLEPKITRSRYLLLDDSVSYGYTNLDTIAMATHVVKKELLFAGAPFTKSSEAFNVNTSDTCKAGFLVWVIQKSGEIEKGDLKTDLTIMPTKVEMTGTVSLVPPVTTSKVLGCIFVVTDDYMDSKPMLAGIALQRNEQWALCFPFKNMNAKAQDSKPTIPQGQLTELDITVRQK